MLAATFLAIFFVPYFFVLIGKIAQRGKDSPQPVQMVGETPAKNDDEGPTQKL